MLAEVLLAALGVLPELGLGLGNVLATHVIPLVPPPNCPPCNSPDQCLVRAAVVLVRALMFHPC